MISYFTLRTKYTASFIYSILSTRAGPLGSKQKLLSLIPLASITWSLRSMKYDAAFPGVNEQWLNESMLARLQGQNP